MEAPNEARRKVEADFRGRANQAAPNLRIFLIGSDSSLLFYRAAVLRQAGYDVQMSSPEAASPVLQKASFHLVMLGHSLTVDQIFDLTALVRERNPRTKVLMIQGADPLPSPSPVFDATILGLDGPSVLLHTVQRLVAAL